MSQRNKMSLVLLNIDQKGFQAFQKMTSHSSFRNDSQRNKNRSTNYENVQYQNNNNYMKYPFGLTEERFKWQNLDNKNQPINVLEAKKQKKYVPKPCCLEGNLDAGFENFFNDILPKKSHRVQSSGKRVSSETYGLGVSRRVLQPEYDNDKKDYLVKPGKKYFQKENINPRRPPAGSMTSLMNRTPNTFPVRGKKKVANASFDNNAINIFSEEYHNNVSYVRPSKKMYL